MVTPHTRALVPDLEMKKAIPEPARWAAGPVWVRSGAVGMKGFCFCAITLFGYIAYVTDLIAGCFVGVLSFLEVTNGQPHFNPISF